MYKLPVLLVLLFAAMVTPGCKKEKTETQAELRIRNMTGFTIYDCTVDPSGTLSDNPGPKAHNYGEIANNNLSAYHTFSSAYRYAWVRLIMNSKTYYLKPFDYTGETKLETGKYIYELGYTAGNDRLSLRLIPE